MNTNSKTLRKAFSDDRNEGCNRSWLADVLVVAGDETSASSIEKVLKDCLYWTSVALNGDQIIETLKHTWCHLILVDLDSIDVPVDYLAGHIRKIEPDIPIIGLGNYASGPCPDVTYVKGPLTVEQIKDIFPHAVSAKEGKGGRRAMHGLALAGCLSVLLYVLLIWIWR